MFPRRQQIKYLFILLVFFVVGNFLTTHLTTHLSESVRDGRRGKAIGEGTGNSEEEKRATEESYRQNLPKSGPTQKPDKHNSTKTKSSVWRGHQSDIGLNISCSKGASVIALVSSLPQNTELRQAIRETWGKVDRTNGTKIQVLFVTGKRQRDEKPTDAEDLSKEIKAHGDLLRGNFVYDMQIKTTVPLIHGLSWILDECSSFNYVLFVSEDTVVMTKRLLERLEYCENNNVSDSKTWMGKVVTNSKVQRLESGMFYVAPEQYSGEFFPPFCTDENGYVFTRRVAIEFVESVHRRSSIVPIADVFISIISKERNWTLIDDDMFTRQPLQLKDVCAAKNAVTMRGPKQTQELIDAWANIDNATLLKDCIDPDLDLVLPAGVDNRAYLEKVMAYKFNNPHICYDKNGNPLDIFMIVLISTPPDHSGMRQAIRETWCGQREILGETIRCVFVMGEKVEESDQLRNQLRHEDIQHGDLIRASFHESFQNLTLKVILGLKWISENCQHAKYFYKGDEDMFVNFHNIISYIKNLRSRGEALTKFFVGSRLYASIRYSPSIPSHKGLKRYHVPDNMYFGHFYPPYCSGGGYILSAETVTDLYWTSMRTSLINVDDAFQGILTKRLGYGPIGHSGFKNWGGKTDTCSLRDKNTMTVHGIGKNPKNLYDVWSTYNNATANCTGVGI